MRDYYRVWAEINLDNIYKNVESMKSNVSVGGDAPKLCAVIKADGYGHGAVPIAKTIDPLVWGYAVATVDEAVQLREHGITKSILVLGFIDEADYETCIKYQIRATLYEKAQAPGMVNAVRSYKEKTGDKNARFPAHIKLDTGMGRLGFLTANEELKSRSIAEIAEVAENPELYLEGCFMHFSKADEMDKTFANLQHERFMSMLSALKERGISFDICHCDNSAGIIDLPEWHADMVRMGISLYGLYPSEEVDKSRIELYPAMSLKSRLTYVKTVPAGTPVSYGGTFVTERESVIGTVPVGYADGYPRNLSNKGSVIINGRRAPIIGRVCMDQFMVDLTDIPGAKKLDEVTLIGTDGDESISVEEAAGLAGTFNYEFVCDISKRVPRVFYRNGEKIGTKDYIHDVYEDFV